MRQPAALLLLPCLLAHATPYAAPVPPDAAVPDDVSPGDPSAPPDGTIARTPLAPALCLARLDAAVRTARDGDARTAYRELDALADRCEHLPQIHHDLGVLAARDDRVPAAIAHFERALDADPRAGATLESLRALHRREATRAYARALGTPGDARTPSLVLQDSRTVGADTLRARAGTEPLPHRVETLEHELHAWWRSAAGDVPARRAHYVDGYPAASALAGRARDARIDWEDVRREITFTEEDAVAVLAQPDADGDVATRLLLLRLDGTRWKIYREIPL